MPKKKNLFVYIYFDYFSGLSTQSAARTNRNLDCPAQILRTGGCGKQTEALHVESVLILKCIDKAKRQHAVPAPQRTSTPLLLVWLSLQAMDVHNLILKIRNQIQSPNISTTDLKPSHIISKGTAKKCTFH